MKNNEIRSIMILGTVLVTFSIVVFCIPFIRNEAFFIAYIFAFISIVIQGYSAYVAFSKGDKAKSRLYGFPIARVGTIYMISQLSLSVLFMALARTVPMWVVIVICVVLLSATVIGLISTEVMRDEIERQDVKLKTDVKLMRSVQSKVRVIADQCKNPALSKSVKELSEDLQYSDPVSSDKLRNIEYELWCLINELERAVLDNDTYSAERLCNKAKSVLAERNRLCKLNK